MTKFSQEVINLAKEGEVKYGVPASVTLAQYALESGYGTSSVAKNKNNYFGVRKANGEYVQYSSMAESFEAHAKLLGTSSLYTSKTNGVTNSKQYIKAISKTYAEDSNYASKIIQIMDSNNLYQYDGDNYKYVPTVSRITTESENNHKSWIVETGESILGSVIKMVTILLISVLAVVFFMQAFEIKGVALRG